MKVAQINSVCGSGSTGKICVAISRLLTEHEIDNVIFYVHGDNDFSIGKKYMSSTEVKVQAFKAKVFGTYGFHSKLATQRLIEALDRFAPDVVQLHNLHGHNVHLGLLFSYLKERKIKVFWTFHDCWAFTGYCMYFDMFKCDKWITGCENCPQRNKYSWIFDQSSWLFAKKKELLSDLDMTIITPSQWLADLVKKSFLGSYPVKVIHNGIDLNIFCPQKSNFREKNGITKNKTILLGVANRWEKRKGIDVFIKLAQQLDKEKFQIVLVGTTDIIDKQLPQHIISIHCTKNQNELAEIYSTADYFINPTREDNFPTVNIEALACGTPVITFDTGGSPEAVTDLCGRIIPCDDFDELCRVLESKIVFSEQNCVARGKEFNQFDRFREYVEIYQLHQE